MSQAFKLSKEQDTKIENWLKAVVYPAVIKEQKATIENPSTVVRWCWEHGYPYEGAINGGLIYKFIPTSIGIVEKVQYGSYELDLTNYEEW